MMLSVIVLIVAGGAGLALAIVSRSKMHKPPWWVVASAMVAAVGGPILVVRAGREILDARELKRWPTVDGIIIKSEIVGDRAIRPLIFYQYRVGDSTYTDSSSLGVPPFGNRRVRRNESETITAEYKSGDSVRVHYDPKSPSDSTLYAREDWASYMRLTLGAILFGVGLYFLVGFGKSTDRSRQG